MKKVLPLYVLCGLGGPNSLDSMLGRETTPTVCVELNCTQARCLRAGLDTLPVEMTVRLSQVLAFRVHHKQFLSDIQPAQVPAQALISLGDSSVNRDSYWSCDSMLELQNQDLREKCFQLPMVILIPCLFIVGAFFDLQIMC